MGGAQAPLEQAAKFKVASDPASAIAPDDHTSRWSSDRNFERAQALGVSPSGLVRATLAEALGRSDPINTERSIQSLKSDDGDRVRLCLRMSREQASATLDGARRAGLNPGDYVGGLVAGVPVLSGSGSRPDHLAALIASSAGLSTLSRNIRHLTSSLRQGDVKPARQYRAMLDRLIEVVRGHLALAACTLGDLQPRSRCFWSSVNAIRSPWGGGEPLHRSDRSAGHPAL